jgi:acetylornithine deacetylase
MQAPATLEILERLIGFPSVCTAKDYLAITDYTESFLKARGFRCHRHTAPEGGKAGLFAAIGPTGAGGVLLSAHLDVVPVAGQNWSSDPFVMTRKDDRVYGRGTADMKGFAAASLRAADKAAQLAAGNQLAAPLKIAFSYDEELGCLGINDMIPHLEGAIGLPDYCLVGEPTSMKLAVGHKGKVSYRVVFRGSSGHSASAPNYLNALHMAADFVGILRDLQADIAANGTRDDAYEIPYTTVHVGVLSGGTTLNMVPNSAELEFEIRHLATDKPEKILERIRTKAAAIVCRLQPVHPQASVRIEKMNAYPGLDIPESSDAAEFFGLLGGIAPAVKVDFGTEAGFFHEALGIPTIACGPGNIGQAHKPDEFIDISQLDACDTMLDLLIGYLAQGSA